MAFSALAVSSWVRTLNSLVEASLLTSYIVYFRKQVLSLRYNIGFKVLVQFIPRPKECRWKKWILYLVKVFNLSRKKQGYEADMGICRTSKR